LTIVVCDNGCNLDSEGRTRACATGVVAVGAEAWGDAPLMAKCRTDS